MQPTTRVIGVLLVAGASVALVSCVGDDPVVSRAAPEDAAVDGASSSDPDGGSGTTCKGDDPAACGPTCVACAVPKDGRATCTGGVCGVACDSPAVACGGACAVLAANADHCGKCDHFCGGGVCLEGKCQPVPVVQGLTQPESFDVGPSALVISQSLALVSCDLPAGCGNAAPKKLAEGYKSMGPVVISGAEVFWVGGSQGDSDAVWLRRCPLTGCSATPVQIQSDTNAFLDHLHARGNTLVWRRISGGGTVFSCTLPTCTPQSIATAPDTAALTTDGSAVFFTRPLPSTTPQLFRCAVGQACAAPTPLAQGRVAGALAVHDGVLYIADPGQASGINDGYIRSTSASAAGAVAVFAREELSPVDVVADADGVFWVNTNLAHVRTCPLTGCAGAPRSLATTQNGVKQIRTDAKFVYWLTADSVYKVAK